MSTFKNPQNKEVKKKRRSISSSSSEFIAEVIKKNVKKSIINEHSEVQDTRISTSIPQKPQDLKIDIFRKAISLSWNGPVDRRVDYNVEILDGEKRIGGVRECKKKLKFIFEQPDAHTRYTFRVWATNTYGQNGEKATLDFQLEPSKLDQLKVEITKKGILVTWQPILFGNIQYCVQAYENGNKMKGEHIVKDAKFNFDEAEPSKTYIFEVWARNSYKRNGAKSKTEEILFAPPQIKGVRTSRQNGGILIEWEKLRDDNMTYYVQPFCVGEPFMEPSRTLNTRYTFTQVEPSKKYYFEVWGRNKYDVVTEKTLSEDIETPPTQIEGVRMSRMDGGILVEWEESRENNVTYYVQPFCDGEPFMEPSSTLVPEYTFTLVEPSKEYEFQVWVRNKSGIDAEKVKSGNIKMPPSSIKGLRTRSKVEGILVEWDELEYDNVTYYIQPFRDGEPLVEPFSTSEAQYIFTDIESSKMYKFQVWARNKHGIEGQKTESEIIFTPPAKIQGLEVKFASSKDLESGTATFQNSQVYQVRPEGSVIRINDCEIRFPPGAVQQSSAVHVTLEVNSDKWPDEYIAITPTLKVKMSSPLLKPATVKLPTWCTSCDVEESPSNVAILHSGKESKTLDVLDTLPLAEERVLMFEVQKFCTFGGVLKPEFGTSSRSRNAVHLSAYVHEPGTGEFHPVLCVDDKTIKAKLISEEHLKPRSPPISFKSLLNQSIKLRFICESDSSLLFCPDNHECEVKEDFTHYHCIFAPTSPIVDQITISCRIKKEQGNIKPLEVSIPLVIKPKKDGGESRSEASLINASKVNASIECKEINIGTQVHRSQEESKVDELANVIATHSEGKIIVTWLGSKEDDITYHAQLLPGEGIPKETWEPKCTFPVEPSKKYLVEVWAENKCHIKGEKSRSNKILTPPSKLNRVSARIQPQGILVKWEKSRDDNVEYRVQPFCDGRPLSVITGILKTEYYFTETESSKKYNFQVWARNEYDFEGEKTESGTIVYRRL